MSSERLTGGEPSDRGVSARPLRTGGGVVFIAGLTHSGSTLLDLVLGSQKRFIGVGEIGALLHPKSRKLEDKDRLCSCGKPIPECVYWGKVLTAVRSAPDARWADRYRMAYGAFRDVFGEDAVLVDSSKSLRSLRVVASLDLPDLRAIHLVRDVRSWTVSRLDVDRRRGMYTLRDLYRRYGSAAWRPFVLRGSFARFLVWYRGNKRIAEFLEGRGIPTGVVSYEELAIDTASSTRRLWEFLGEPGNEVRSGFESSSHIALGNRMRLQPSRRNTIRYDPRWMYRRDWLWPSVAFPNVMSYNNRVTYAGLSAKSRS